MLISLVHEDMEIFSMTDRSYIARLLILFSDFDLQNVTITCWYRQPRVEVYFFLITLSICVEDFFWRGGGAWHASGRQKGAAEKPLRGCLNSKP